MKHVVKTQAIRRSRTGRWTAMVLSSTLLLSQFRAAYSASSDAGKVALPDDRPWAFSGHLRPSTLRRTDGPTSDDQMWNLFDSDTKTGLSGTIKTVFEAHFDEPVAITSVGVFGASLGQLTVKSADGVVLAQKGFDAPRAAWERVPLEDERAAGSLKRLVVSWTGKGDSSRLPELEFWGRKRSEKSASLPDSGLPEGALLAVAKERSRMVSGAAAATERTFNVDVNVDPRSIERAFLLYHVEGVRAPAQIARSLNGGPGLRGPVVAKADEPIVEEISPRALKAGVNLVTFHPPTATDPVGYRVREVAVAWVHDDAMSAVAQDPGLGDGRESTAWDSRKTSVQAFSFEAPVQPHELEFRLVHESNGSLTVTEAGGSRAQIDLRGLRAGWHRVKLDALPVVADLRATVTTRPESPIIVSEMRVTGSPPPASEAPSARVIEPQRGECVDHRVDLRLLASPAPISLSANGHVLKDLQIEGDAVAASFPDDLVAAPGKPSVFELAATYRTGPARKLQVHLEACMDRARLVDSKPQPDVGAPFKTTVSAEKGGLISYKEATLEIPPGALDADTEITVRPLKPGEYHALDAGMVNVTAHEQVFRFGPHNLTFKKAVRLSLPIDGKKVAAGEDLETLYFDETERRWREIPKSGSSQQELSSLTTHFTDFIASTLAIPAHPGVQSLNPTSIKDMKLSDPLAGVEMIAPPEPNNRGTANLSYPIIVPPGRKGVQPKLAITYSSDAKNGPLGVGWNVAIPTIEVDTRFGVPKYQGNDRYLLNGQELSKLASPPTGAPAGTYFVLRNESSFAWIQQVALSGGGYSWLVTDKAGTKFTYGASASARLQPNTSAGAADPVRAARWFLEKEEDMWGNQVLYSYTGDTGTYGTIGNVSPSGDRYYQIYLSSISYTATSHSGPAPQYSVGFVYSSTRPDAFTDGRFGYLVYTQKLLSTINVNNSGAVVRQYGLTYQASDQKAFDKSLLGGIQVFGKGGKTATAAIATHTFSYYQPPHDSSNQLQLWGPAIEGADSATNNDPASPTYHLTTYDGPQTGAATPNLTTSLSNESHHSSGGGVYGVAGPVSVGVGKSSSSTITAPGFADMNGDGLVDVMPARPDYVASQQALFDWGNGVSKYTFTPEPQPLWAKPLSVEAAQVLNGSFSVGAYGLSLGVSQSYGNSAEASRVLKDVNGDGFPDFVQTPASAKSDPSLSSLVNNYAGNSLVVQLGDHGSFKPPVEWKGFDHQQLGFSCNQIFTQASSSPTRTPYDFPTVDPIVRWTAPYAGRVRIGGAVQLTETGGDGVVATLFKGNQKIWERDIQGTDTTACIPAAASPEPGSGCSASPTIIKTVAKGDRFYTRVNGKATVDHDAVSWSPTFDYIDAPASEANARESWGRLRYKFSQDTDSKPVSADYVPWIAPESGHITVAVAGDKLQEAAERTRFIARLVSTTSSGTVTVTPVFGEGSEEFWDSATVASPFTGNYGSVDVKAGDLLYVGIVQSIPYDPDRFVASALVTYTSLTRVDPQTGATTSGPPICVPRDPTLGADGPTSCTIANDPDPSHPSDGEALSQYVPIQVAQRRWTMKPPVSPAATPDGRKAVFAPTANPTLQLCGNWNYNPFDPNGGGVIGLIQGVNKMLSSSAVNLGQACVSVSSGVAAGDQVIFAVYSFDDATVGPSNYTATMNGQSVPVEVYTIDSSYAPDTGFFSLGQTDNMSGGMNGFSEGFWNGNYDFDESFIVASENDHYQRATVISYPTALTTLQGARVQWGLSSIGHFVSKAAKVVVSATKKVVVTAGSYTWRGFKAVGSIASKALAWGVCQTSNVVSALGGPNFFGSYTVNGLSYAETRTSTGNGSVAGFAGASSHSQSNAALDLVDMNGDGVADDVTPGGIRYATIDATGAATFAAFPSLTGLPKGLSPPTLRTVESNMFSTEINGSISGKTSGNNTPQIATDSKGQPVGLGGSIGLSFSVGKGFARTQRQLVDMNGDGLPDIAESDPSNTSTNLRVYINYGYGFGNPVNWTMPSWGALANPTTGPGFESLGKTDSTLTAILSFINGKGVSVTSADYALQLDEVVNAGDGVGVAATVQTGVASFDFGAVKGSDANYVLNFTRLIDVNGDGLPDQLYKSPSNNFWVKLNTGTSFDQTLLQIPAAPWPSFFSPLQKLDGLSYRRGSDASYSGSLGGSVVVGGGVNGSTASGGATQSIEMMDFNGDGLPDHVVKGAFKGASGADATRASEVLIRYNQAGKSNLLQTVTNPLGGGFTLDYNREGNFVGDFYSGKDWAFDMPTSRWCLSSVTTFDNFQHSYTDTIQYGPMAAGVEGGLFTSGIGSGFYDRVEKEFYGFSHVRVIHGDGFQHMYYYRNDAYYAQGTLLAEYEGDDTVGPMRGSVHATTFAQIAGTTPAAFYVQRVDSYDEKYPYTQPLHDYAPSSGPDASLYHQTARIYDGAGNLTTSADLGDYQVASDDVWFQMTYSTFTGSHFNPVTRVVASATSGGSALRQRASSYTTVNGRPTLSQITDTILGGNQPTTGTPYSGSGKKVTYGFTFDSASGDFGNLKTYTDPSGATLTYVYDSSGTHITSVTDNLGYVSSSTMNMDFGLPTTTIDENGKVTTFKYDAFGRTTDVWGPTDPTAGAATVHVDYSQGNAGGFPAWALTKNKDVQSTTNDTIDVVTMVDGMGRIVQTKKEAEVSSDNNGGTTQVMLVSGQVLYDLRGRPITQNDPVALAFNASRETTFEVVAPANTVTYSYDGLGRLLLTTYANGANDEHLYFSTWPGWSFYPSGSQFGGRGLEVDAYRDPIGAYTALYFDALGRRVGTMENAMFAGAWASVVNYQQYDNFGNIGTAIDNNNNTTTATYDSLNHLVALSSPDAGLTEFRYGTNGLLMQKQTGQLRPSNKWINYVYDTNTTRVKTIDYPTMADVTFTYGLSTDTTGNVKGRIKSVTMEGGTEQRTYDAFGNVAQTVTTLNQLSGTSPAPTVTMKFSYDWMGRMQSMTFPKLISNWVVPTGDGEVVSYVYDKGGNLKAITGKATTTSTPETYLTARTYNNLGQLAVDVAGNGVVTSRGYDPTRHWLTAINTATSSTAVPFQATGFAYRNDGLITSVTSTGAALAPDNQPVGTGTTTTTYDYDLIKELISSTSTYRGHATYGYQTSSTFGYDTVGNMVSKSQTDAKLTYANAAATSPSSTATMPATTYGLAFNYTGGRPHATNTTSETTSTSTVITHNVSYDGSGNNLGETAGPNTRVLTWDEADRLKQVVVNGATKSTFRYNPDGERTQRLSAGNATNFYFNQFLVIEGTQYVTKNIFAGTDRLASKTEATVLTTPLRHFYHGDQVGSTSYITDASKTLVQHERYFPFGERWADPGSEERAATNGASGPIYPRNWLFTSKELDTDTGYYYYGARYYDARNARWLSPDPILASYMQGDVNGGVFTPRNLGLYSYSWNNPIVLTDSNGAAPTAVQIEAFRKGTLSVGREMAAGRMTVGDAGELIHAGGVQSVGGAGDIKDTSGFVPAMATLVAKAVTVAVAVADLVGGLTNGLGTGSGTTTSTAPGGPAVPNTTTPAAPMGGGTATAAPGPNFVVTPQGEAITVPHGASGPTSTQAPGVQYTGGNGGPGLDSRVTGVRIMEGNANQDPRAVYMNRTGQTVNPSTGRTVPNSDPKAHHYLKPFKFR